MSRKMGSGSTALSGYSWCQEPTDVTTQKKVTSATARNGVNFIRDIVERANCTFQEIDQHNDLGNDAYIEFVCAEEATGCCIAIQVKSGESYVKADGSLILKADRAHFEYWKSHSLPICGIVHDPTRSLAAWCDITGYLKSNPHIIDDGPYQIPVADAQLFNDTTFETFREHFLKYKIEYSNNAHYGSSLERFTPFFDIETRIDALSALFSFHRDRPSTWCYVASLLRSIEDPRLLRVLVRALEFIPGHGDIFWSARNNINEATRLSARMFMEVIFGREEAVKLLSVVDEYGFERGKIGQSVHAIISIIRNIVPMLNDIAFDENISVDIRYTALWLFIYYTQELSVQTCLDTIREFRRKVSDGPRNIVLAEIEQILSEDGYLSFY
ncbi:MAG TPA: hypothetical protein DCQ33_14595 [Nitrospira sp.]|nr:hypothetical protein [Nitrospira sp.]